jgi:hypothetical protein
VKNIKNVVFGVALVLPAIVFAQVGGTRYGNTTQYSNGVTANQYGNTTQFSNGVTATQYGNTTQYSNGKTCTTYGNTTTCN